MQFYLSIKSNKFGTKHFFYTYEYTLDLIFKAFAGYFTILTVVNLIFKTEESWEFEKKCVKDCPGKWCFDRASENPK